MWDVVGQWAEISALCSPSLLQVDVQSTEQWLGVFSLQQILSTKLLIVIPLGFYQWGISHLGRDQEKCFPLADCLS